MSTDDMITYRDPDAPGMAFGRPPTRPGHRRDAATDDSPDPSVAPDEDDRDDLDSSVAADPADPVDPPDGETAAVDPPDPPDGEIAAVDPIDPPDGETVAVDPPDPPDGETAGVDPVDPPDGESAAVDLPEAEAETETAAVDPHGASPGLEPAVDPEPPPSPAALGAEPALDADQVADLRRRWAATQTGFVDDPRRAVEVADDIVAEAVGALQAAIDGRRRAMAEPWQDDADASTDALLAAFQGYRAVFERVLSV